MRYSLPILLLLLAAGGVLSAVERAEQGDLSYLDRTLQPSWRGMALPDVLQEIAQLVDVPVKTSRAFAIEGDWAQQPVIWLARDKHPALTVFERLEQYYDLRITAGPLQWRVETVAEYRQRHRQPRQIDLRRYGADLEWHDHTVEHALGPVHRSDGGGGFSLFDDGGEDSPSISWDHVLDQAREVIDGDIGTGGTGRLQMVSARLTDEEVAALQQVLQQRLDQALQSRAWVVRAGILPQGAGQLSTGLIDAAEVAQLLPRLRQLERIDLVGLRGQQVTGELVTGDLRTRGYDVGGEGLPDPDVELRHAGITVALRGLLARQGSFVDLSLDWAEPVAQRSIAVQDRRLVDPVQREAELVLDGEVERREDKDTDPVSLEGTIHPGSTVRRRPVTGDWQSEDWWSWRPRLQVVLPAGKAAVICAPHPGGGRAVVIVESADTPEAQP